MSLRPVESKPKGNAPAIPPIVLGNDWVFVTPKGVIPAGLHVRLTLSATAGLPTTPLTPRVSRAMEEADGRYAIRFVARDVTVACRSFAGREVIAVIESRGDGGFRRAVRVPVAAVQTLEGGE